MTPPPVYTQASGHVLTIVLARPEKRNAVDRETANALRQAFTDFEADDTLKVAVLWGEGAIFAPAPIWKPSAIRSAATRSRQPEQPTAQWALPACHCRSR